MGSPNVGITVPSFEIQVPAIGQPLGSIFAGHIVESVGHVTGHVIGQAVPSFPKVFGMHCSGIGHPLLSVPPGHLKSPAEHGVGHVIEHVAVVDVTENKHTVVTN